MPQRGRSQSLLMPSNKWPSKMRGRSWKVKMMRLRNTWIKQPLLSAERKIQSQLSRLRWIKLTPRNITKTWLPPTTRCPWLRRWIPISMHTQPIGNWRTVCDDRERKEYPEEPGAVKNRPAEESFQPELKSTSGNPRSCSHRHPYFRSARNQSQNPKYWRKSICMAPPHPFADRLLRFWRSANRLIKTRLIHQSPQPSYT